MEMKFCVYCQIETPHIYEKSLIGPDLMSAGIYSCYVCGQYCHGDSRDLLEKPVKPGDLKF